MLLTLQKPSIFILVLVCHNYVKFMSQLVMPSHMQCPNTASPMHYILWWIHTHTDPSQITLTTPCTLRALTSLSAHPDLLTLILPSLTNYLSAILAHPSPNWEVAQYTAASLLSLVTEHGNSDMCRGLLEGTDGVLVRVVCLCIRTRAHSEEYSHVLVRVRELVWRYCLSASDEWVH